jgi:hypothetical protein
MDIVCIDSFGEERPGVFTEKKIIYINLGHISETARIEEIRGSQPGSVLAALILI